MSSDKWHAGGEQCKDRITVWIINDFATHTGDLRWHSLCYQGDRIVPVIAMQHCASPADRRDNECHSGFDQALRNVGWLSHPRKCHGLLSPTMLCMYQRPERALRSRRGLSKLLGSLQHQSNHGGCQSQCASCMEKFEYGGGSGSRYCGWWCWRQRRQWQQRRRRRHHCWTQNSPVSKISSSNTSRWFSFYEVKWIQASIKRHIILDQKLTCKPSIRSIPLHSPGGADDVRQWPTAGPPVASSAVAGHS